jgi:hypothetical protein
MNRTSPRLALSNWHASRLIAGALAIIIFLIDTFTPLDSAIAVLYVIVVLMAANFPVVPAASLQQGHSGAIPLLAHWGAGLWRAGSKDRKTSG